ncbi:hypothetical protein FKM82_026930 [Ascaphus truei]
MRTPRGGSVRNCGEGERETLKRESEGRSARLGARQGIRQFGEADPNYNYMEQEEDWDRDLLLDPAWEKQQRKILALCIGS